MSAPIFHTDYVITTAVGSGLVLASQEAIRLATKNPHIGRNECIAALGGAVLGTAAKFGINYYTKDKTQYTPFCFKYRYLLDRSGLSVTLATATAACMLFAYFKKS